MNRVRSCPLEYLEGLDGDRAELVLSILSMTEGQTADVIRRGKQAGIFPPDARPAEGGRKEAAAQ